MAKVKSLTATVAKWKARASVAGEDYERGIDDPKEDWETATKAAEERYKAGTQAAIARGAFGKGVTRAGSAKHKARSKLLGKARYSEGVAASESDYSKGVSAVLQTLAGVVYPTKYPRGDSRNIERVKAPNEALRKFKLSQT
jgi:hypothetical protein